MTPSFVHSAPSSGTRELYRRLPVVAGVGILLVLATLLVFASPQTTPEISLAIALVVVFFLPGYLVAKILFPGSALPSLTDLPVAFVFSLAVWSIPAAILRLLRMDWSWFNALFVLTLWGLGLVYSVRLWQSHDMPALVSPRSVLVIEGVVLALGLGAAWISAHAGRSVDDWGYLVVIQLLRAHQTFGLDNFQNARDALRFAIQTPLFLEAFVSRISQFDPVSLVRDILPPLFVPIALAGLYAWAKEFSGRAWVGLVAVVCQIIYFLLVVGQTPGPGFWFFGRIGQDKFMTWLLVLPIVLLFFWRYMSGGHGANLFAYGIALAAIVMVHPIGLALVCLAVGGFALLNLIQPSRLPPRRWLLATFWILPAGLIALLFRLLTPNNYFLLTAGSDPAVASYLSLSDQRLVLLPPTFYFSHPAQIMNPLTLIAVCLVPLLARRLRTDPRAQFLWGSTLVPLALLYTPAGAWVLGQLVMPWELWRLTWVLPVGLALSFLAMQLREYVAASRRGHTKFVLIWSGMVAVAVVALAPVDVAQSLTLWARPSDVSPQAQELLRSLPRFVSSPSLVLAPLEWQQMMPAYDINALPATTISMSSAGLHDADVQSFYASTLYTDKTVRLIAAPGISVIVLPVASYLNEQLLVHKEFFAPLYKNQDYVSYKVIRKPTSSLETVGLLNLEQGHWDAALINLQRAVVQSNDNALVYFGLGYAYAGLHEPVQAEAAFQQALVLAPDLRLAHLKLGELYKAEGLGDKAAREFSLAK